MPALDGSSSSLRPIFQVSHAGQLTSATVTLESRRRRDFRRDQKKTGRPATMRSTPTSAVLGAPTTALTTMAAQAATKRAGASILSHSLGVDRSSPRFTTNNPATAAPEHNRIVKPVYSRIGSNPPTVTSTTLHKA